MESSLDHCFQVRSYDADAIMLESAASKQIVSNSELSAAQAKRKDQKSKNVGSRYRAANLQNNNFK